MGSATEEVTDGDMEVQGGSDLEVTVPDHDGVDLAQPPQNAITVRGRDVVVGYFGDLKEARAVALAPPAFGDLVTRLFRRPEVLANSALLIFLNRLYAIIVLPVVALLYFLISAQLHPARALVVDGLLGLAVWMWFFS